MNGILILGTIGMLSFTAAVTSLYYVIEAGLLQAEADRNAEIVARIKAGMRKQAALRKELSEKTRELT